MILLYLVNLPLKYPQKSFTKLCLLAEDVGSAVKSVVNVSWGQYQEELAYWSSHWSALLSAWHKHARFPERYIIPALRQNHNPKLCSNSFPGSSHAWPWSDREEEGSHSLPLHMDEGSKIQLKMVRYGPGLNPLQAITSTGALSKTQPQHYYYSFLLINFIFQKAKYNTYLINPHKCFSTECLCPCG